MLDRELYLKAQKLFHFTFGLSFKDYVDLMMTSIIMKPVIDIYKFDDWLHDRFGSFEKSGLSSYEVIAKNFGDEVAAQVKKLVGVPV
jgi:hypothetical protein